jgi:hypothetical protein
MNLRPELLPPPVAPQRLAALTAAIVEIAGRLDRGEPCADLIGAFNADTGSHCTAHDFHRYDSQGSAEDFAYRAARPRWPRVPDITRDELVEIAGRITSGHTDTDWYVLLFDTNVTRPAASSLLFDPPTELGDDPPVARIVDEALAYRPIEL